MLGRLLVLAAVAVPISAQVLESARHAFEAGEYATAAALFERANVSAPRCDTDFYVGLSRYHLQQLEAALIAFKAAVQCDPKLLPAHLALAETYLVMHNAAEALRAYTEALSVAPRDTAALRGAATIYLSNENNEKAAPLLETLVSLTPSDRQARVDLGAAYAATGMRERAEEQFREALRLKADDPSALTGFGNLYEKQGDDDKAVPLLLRAVAAAPNSYEPRFVLGSAYNRLGRYAEARTALQAALQLGGDHLPEVYYQLARACGNLGMDEERKAMLAKFSELTAKAKTTTENQRTVARLLQESEPLIDAGNLQGAVEKLQAAQAMQPSNDYVLFRLASLCYDLKDYKAARSYAQEAIQIAPVKWVYHFLLGLTDLDSGRYSEACNSLEIAARLDPSRVEIRDALAKARHAQAARQ